MNTRFRLLFGLILIVLLLSGCQLFSGDEATPAGQTTPEAAVTVVNAPLTPSPTVIITTATATATATAVASASAIPTFTPLPVPASQRIQFAPGATSATVNATITVDHINTYVFGASAGQTARVAIGSTDGSVNFALAMMEDAAPFKRLDDPARSWQGTLPETRDYIIIISGPQAASYWLTLAIDPLPEADLPVILDPGSPPANRCVVVHPGGTAVVTVYLGPSTAFAPIAYLGNWAEVLSSESGWHQIQIGPGQTGWVRETDVGFAGPCDNPGEVIRFELQANGSPLRTSAHILPGQAHRYVFRGEAGQRLLVDLTSSGQANFALLGVDSGQPLKRVVDENRTWEGILPQTQDYLLTVIPANEAADYDLTLALVMAPPMTVIYDSHTDSLLGGFKDALWVDANTAAISLLGGEQYGVYHLGVRLGQAAGSAAVPTGSVICPGQTVHLTPPPSHPSALAATGATWEVAPQLVAPVSLSQRDRQAVVDLLAGQGLAITTDQLQVREALGTDLDQDGFGEIIAQASRLRDEGSTPAVNAGDYFVMAVLLEINGQLYAEPLVLDVYPQANDLAYPWRYKVSGALDLNGNGNLEVILTGVRWEGESTTVYSVGPDGGVVRLLERRCVA